MSHILLAPHNDDETLFAAFLAQRHRAHVHVCLYDTMERVLESEYACDQLGVEFTQWMFDARKPDWDALRERMEHLPKMYEHVIAPAPRFEANGHSPHEGPRAGWGIFHHDWIGEIALEMWGPERTILYTTYTRWGGRDRSGTEVVPELAWIANKLRALACYRSQLAAPGIDGWFLDTGLREYVA